jgi:tetratricopeptide (TPR) repeat protein
MRAHYLIVTGRWTDAAAEWSLDTAMATTAPKAMDAYALGVAQLSQGKRGEAERALTRLEQLARAEQSDTVNGSNSQVPSILATQLKARLTWVGGDRDRAITILREAAGSEDQLPLEFGPPDIVKPTHELLGELLLAADQPALAQREFRRALELAPGRSVSLLGLARAARAAGDDDAARRALDQLERNWNGADKGLVDVVELRRLRAS